MLTDLEFLIVLLEQEKDACIAVEDFDGPCGAALKQWQEMGFVGQEPGLNPVLTCPYCDEGSVYFLVERYRCDSCCSTVDRRHLLLWPFHRDPFFRWLAAQLGLTGITRRIDSSLWHLGTLTTGSSHVESFYRFDRPLTPEATARLNAYRDTLLLYGVSPPEADGERNAAVSLLSLLRPGPVLTVAVPRELVPSRQTVRFDHATGELRLGRSRMGTVPVGSREHAFLACLSEHPDEFVSYAALKRYIQAQTGSIDSTEEATFCQGLKSRIKRKWIKAIDGVVRSSHTGEGYRLPAAVAGV